MSLSDRLGDWYTFLEPEFQKDYMKKIALILKNERSKYNIFPEADDVFRAYRECSYHNIKVCILGQDPYHTPGMAHGLAFSTPNEMPTPPSLDNILDELQREYEMDLHLGNDLSSWAEQGVLLLNTALTVRQGQAKSHSYIGWQNLIEKTIEKINISPQPIVFMLWGNDAKKYIKLIDTDHHKVLSAPHPSPLSAYRGFFGCNHFKECNNFLENNNLEPINWFSIKTN